MHETAQLFKALGDETRLRILNLLVRGELCVCDIVGVLGISQPKVSRHLAILRRADLVGVRREGKRKFYALTKDRSPLQQTLFRYVRSCLSEFEVLAQDRRRLESMHASLHRAPRAGAAIGRH